MITLINAFEKKTVNHTKAKIMSLNCKQITRIVSSKVSIKLKTPVQTDEISAELTIPKERYILPERPQQIIDEIILHSSGMRVKDFNFLEKKNYQVFCNF